MKSLCLLFLLGASAALAVPEPVVSTPGLSFPPLGLLDNAKAAVAAAKPLRPASPSNREISRVVVRPAGHFVVVPPAGIDPRMVKPADAAVDPKLVLPPPNLTLAR